MIPALAHDGAGHWIHDQKGQEWTLKTHDAGA